MARGRKKGFKVSKESREKISRNNARYMLGKHHSEEAKKKMSLSKIGNKHGLGKIRPLDAIKKTADANRGKKRSDEFRKKLSQRMKGHTPWNKGKKYHNKAKGIKKPERCGPNHHWWKGGITDMHQKIRTSVEYKLWRKAVFERDNYTCIFCGIKNGGGKTIRLEADHIKSFAEFPELRFAIDNGRTLCKDCHRKTPTYGRVL